MTNLNHLLSPLFLDEKEIKKLIELLFFSYREFTIGPDKVLEKIEFGRTHHKIIYFIGKQKKITIKELLKILQIPKQSLSRTLNQLVKKKYIILTAGTDKRTKILSLTQKGIDLEKELSTIQITRIRNILKKANENEINGFKKILYAMIDSEGKKIFNSMNNT